MKRLMMMLAAVTISLSLGAQTLQDGIKMYNYKRYRMAEQILTPLAATDPLANYYLGLAFLSSGDVTKAGSFFSKYPDDFANISGTARVAFANKDVAKGMQIARDLAGKAKKKDWQPLKYAADAITYSTGGDYNQAIAWYKDALVKSPDDVEMHIGQGDAYRKISGGGGEAMNNYEAITDKNPNNSLALSRIGDLWYEARTYKSAVDNYGKAKDADKNNPLPYKSLADAYARSGSYQLALQNIKQYLPLSDSTESDKIEYVGILYLAQSYCEAAQFAQNMLAHDKLDKDQKTSVIGIIGFSQAECGDSVSGLNNLHTYFSQQDPKKILPGDYLNYGKVFLKMGLLDSAGFYYTKGIAGDTSQNKTEMYRQIADAFKAKKDYCKSAEWYDNLVKANPNAEAFDYAWRSIMFYYCKDYGKAMDASNSFAARYPTQPSAPFWQARIQQVIDSDATTGSAVLYFKKWLDMVGPNYEKKNDLKGAYEYLMFFYYNSKDKENENIYKEKIKAIDPNDNYVKQIEEAEKASEKKQPKKPFKGK